MLFTFLSIFIIFIAIIIVILLFSLFKKQNKQHYEIFTFNQYFQKLLHRPIDIINYNFYKKKMFSKKEHDILKYSDKVSSGLEILKTKTIIVCGLIYNAEKQVSFIKNWISDLEKICKSVHVVIVENNSVDRTRELLNEWKKTSNSNIYLVCSESNICNNFDYSQIESMIHKSPSSKRIEKMSYLRNCYMKYIFENNMKADYVFLMDFDLNGILFWDGIFHSIHEIEQNQIEVMACNGILQDGLKYYDTFAYAKTENELDWNTNFDKQNHDQDVIKNVSKKYQENLKLDNVKSAFGGFAIYKFASFNGKQYDFNPTGYSCEHCIFHKQFNTIMVNPRMIFLIKENLT